MRGGLTFNRLCAAFLFFAVPIYGAGAIEFGCETRASRTAEVARTPGSPSQTIDPPGGKSPELPVKRVDTTVPDAAGATIRVKSGDDLQTALDKARPGDTILLEPGSVFTGNFRLQQKAGGGRLGNKPKWIIIETNLPGDRMPAPGKRLDPRHVSGLARVESNNSEPALRAVAGAGYYRLIAVELTIAPSVKANYGIVRLGEGNEANLNQLPHNMIIDRCYIHGSPDTELRRGVALNSADSAVINSYLSECHETGADSQAICSWNSPGPFEISNNYLEGSGENVMFGGSDPKIGGLVCSDITFSRNYCSKPEKWREPGPSGRPWGVKNLFELKNANRVLIEDNVFENNWLQAQTGFAILFKSVDQEGRAPWSVTENITFRNNVVRHSSSGINIQGRDPRAPSGRTSSLTIENNLFEDINGQRWGGEGTFVKITDAEDVRIDHNTVANSGSIITAYGEKSVRFAFTNNIVRSNTYGIKGDGTSSGVPTLQRYFSEYMVTGNAIAGGSASIYPPGNCFPPAEIVAMALRSAVKDACRGTDGKPAGCNLTGYPDLTADGAGQ